MRTKQTHTAQRDFKQREKKEKHSFLLLSGVIFFYYFFFQKKTLNKEKRSIFSLKKS